MDLESLIAAVFLVVTTATPLRVLQWNVRVIPFTGFGERLPRIAAVVARERPDFVAFEEVWTSGGASAIRRALAPMGYASCCANRGPFRPGGLLLLWDTTKGWRVDDVAFVRYARAAPRRMNEGDAFVRNGFLIGNAHDAGGRAFRIAVTHLQAQYPDHHHPYVDVRLAQVEQVAAALGDGDAIVAGDFNTTPDDAAYAWLAAHGWRDATAEARRQCQAAASLPCGTNFEDGKLTPDWFDYVFVRGGFGNATAQLIRNARTDVYSDHEGVLCTISP